MTRTPTYSVEVRWNPRLDGFTVQSLTTRTDGGQFRGLEYTYPSAVEAMRRAEFLQRNRQAAGRTCPIVLDDHTKEAIG